MKEITIQIPDNCELVKEGDTYKIRRISFPKSWEEYCKMYPNMKGEYYINFNSQLTIVCDDSSRSYTHDKNLLSSNEEAEAFLALMQLRQLRKAWVGEYNPSGNNFYAIIFSIGTGLKIVDYTFSYRVLSFPTLEMAKEFLTCFKDLCEKAKILL